MPNDDRLLLLDGPAAEALLVPVAVLAAVRDAFVLHSRREGRVFPVVREALATGGVFGLKSGDVQSRGLLGFKAAGYWPNNRALGGQPHQATIVLIDPTTGRPLCIVDGNAVTKMRTGAAGALGLQCLARPESQSLSIFGTGVQSTVQLTYALMVLPGLRRVRYLSASGSRDAAFEAQFADRLDLSHATDANGAVAASDIVVTATPGQGALFDSAAVRPGTHLNCVGADTKGKRELPAGLIESTRVYVDDAEQARQIGELQWAPATRATELGDIITKTARIQRNATDVTVFDMTGLALQDLTVARLLYEGALEQNLGLSVPWPWK